MHTEAQVTECRIYEGADTTDLPCSEVFYGPDVKALAVELYGIGVVSIKRIQEIIWSITNKALMVAAGTLYGFSGMGRLASSENPDVYLETMEEAENESAKPYEVGRAGMARLRGGILS